MPEQNQKPARLLALEVLNQFDKLVSSEHIFVNTILNPMLGQTDEKARTTDIVFGTIRNRFTIDAVITKLSDCPPQRIPKKIHNIIRIGVYELIYCPSVAQYAAVNEAAQNASLAAGKKQVGFVNAVLRKATRHIADREVTLSQDDSHIVPCTKTTGCKFDVPILPDPKTETAEFFAAAFSIPNWLISDWLNQYGLKQTRKICFASNRRPSVYIRPNLLKTSFEQIASMLNESAIEFELTPDSYMIKIKKPGAVAELPGFSQGLFTIQDPAAANAVRILDPKPDWKILDLCSAPGTKSMQLAELTSDKARIFATDINRTRLKRVRENISRLDFASIKIIEYSDAENFAPFDAILLDVPCSNSGVLSKRPEVRFRITPDAVKQITKTQSELLQFASSLIKTGGKLCYSTCSIQKDENENLIKNFLAQNPAFELEKELLTLPSTGDFDSDGSYCAILIRR